MVSVAVSPTVSSAKLSFSLEHIDEAIPTFSDGLGHGGTGVQLEVEIHGRCASTNRRLWAGNDIIIIIAVDSLYCMYFMRKVGESRELRWKNEEAEDRV